MEKECVKPSASVTTIIGSSDGPTSVFLLGSSHKLNIKQKIEYICEKYDFVELTKESSKYNRL